MKFGVRKPSLKKTIKARTTGKIKRKVKSSVNPLYGKKGMGYVKNPKRAVYNKIYNKTTVGINPLSKLSTPSDTSTKTSSIKSEQAIGYTKKEKKQETVTVRNPVEKWIRRVIRKDSSDTKIITRTVITEQYTVKEMLAIQDEARSCLHNYNQSMRYLTDTNNADVFFPRLQEAEMSLSTLVSLTQNHSFLVAEGDDVIEAQNRLLEEKENIIKQFVHTHISESIKGANNLKTDRGRRNRLISNYNELSTYFSDLPRSTVEMINTIWNSLIPQEDLINR
ncbi:hypothetical protein [Alkalibacterium thalassium]|uniref:Uncharacterized protein n=1 Tax=Alkalibacterium thalassium TaxID=426701 RepID=A0A1G8YKW2_9LACT|nr:hypothetical protein [Alkalibacterium thalassium]SDK03094.1 hypothetical protein SAMN04488098_101022 [Alkalibacterium thalassium]